MTGSAWSKGVTSVNLLEKATFQKSATQATLTFKHSGKSKSRYLKFTKPVSIKHKGIKFNDKVIPVVQEDLSYDEITAIPASMLKRGVNKIVMRIGEKTREFSASDIKLTEMSRDDFAFVTTPIIGDASDRGFRVTCRLNLPGTVILKVNKKTLVSINKMIHSFYVPGLRRGKTYPYKMYAKHGNKTISTATYKFTAYDPNKLVFTILGDSRGNGKNWKRVAEAAAKEVPRPQFTVHTGDMVNTGSVDSQWVKAFAWGGSNVFPTMPYYLVNGNHDKKSSWITSIFSTPTNQKIKPGASEATGTMDWKHRVGSVLILASPSVESLEKELAKTDAEFIFVCTHAPAYSSGPHGGSKGAQKLLAVLEKYKGTAMFAGHDHAYERSEPGKGVSVIVSGGAGAPLYGAKEGTNPHSKVFKKCYHYCTLTVKGKQCIMVAKDVDGNVIDTYAWKARSVKK